MQTLTICNKQYYNMWIFYGKNLMLKKKNCQLQIHIVLKEANKTYSQTSITLPSIKRSSPIKWTVVKFSKISPLINCKIDFYIVGHLHEADMVTISEFPTN